jgi:hypothetical protein
VAINRPRYTYSECPRWWSVAGDIHQYRKRRRDQMSMRGNPTLLIQRAMHMQPTVFELIPAIPGEFRPLGD